MSTLLKSASKRQEATVAAATSSSSKGKGRLPTSNTTVALADEEDDDEEEDDVEMESDRSSKKRKLPTSDDLASGSAKKERKPRKDKVLLLSSRGTTGRMRHLINDLSVLLPHTKKDAKLDSKSSLHLLNELADLHSCNNTLYFEARRHEDLYAWMSRSPNGPSVKCHVQNVHTMDELKMTGNCLKGSRGLVCFDGGWEERIKNGEEQWAVMKELLTHVSTHCNFSFCCGDGPVVVIITKRKEKEATRFLTRIIFPLSFSLFPDLLRPQDFSSHQAVHRPHPHLLSLGQQDLVPKLPNH